MCKYRLTVPIKSLHAYKQYKGSVNTQEYKLNNRGVFQLMSSTTCSHRTADQCTSLGLKSSTMEKINVRFLIKSDLRIADLVSH